jgi:hypothetical protein
MVAGIRLPDQHQLVGVRRGWGYWSWACIDTCGISCHQDRPVESSTGFA